MNEPNSAAALCETIARLRREKELTQEALAARLGVTFQAVSKWENGQSCPDISLLPPLAEIFGVTIGALFGMEERQPGTALPWEDDGKLRAAVFLGRQLMTGPVPEAEKIVFEYRGEAKDVVSNVSLQCWDVGGSVSAKGPVGCKDVGGSVNAMGPVTCGSVGGKVNAMGPANCGNIEGDLSANGGVNCGDVEGDVETSGDVNCATVGGDVKAKILKCKKVEGDARVGKWQPCEAD